MSTSALARKSHIAPRRDVVRKAFSRACQLATFTLCTLFAAARAPAGVNTWSALGPDGGGISKVVFHKTSDRIVYALTSAGFYRSTDAGAHWMTSGTYSAQLAGDFAVDPTDSDRVYLVTDSAGVWVSTDAGATFSVLQELDRSTGDLVAIGISADGQTIYVLAASGVYLSTDRGRTWQARSREIFSGLWVKAQVDPMNSATLYAGDHNGVRVSYDSAGTWTNITPPDVVVFGVDDFVMDPTEPNRLWAATISGLKLSTDRGATWTTAYNDWIVAVALDPQSPSTVYAGEFGGMILRGNGGTWTDIATSLDSIVPEVIAVSPHDSTRIMVDNPYGLNVTTNGGASWSRSDSGITASHVTGFTQSSVRNRAYLEGVGLAAIDDGTDSVTVFDPRPFYSALNFGGYFSSAMAAVSDADGSIIAAYSSRIALSIDGGLAWTRLPFPNDSNDEIIDLAATDTLPSIYYASSQLSLRKSLDQGATWIPITTGLPAGYSGGVLAIAPSDSSILYSGPARGSAANSPFGVGAGVYKSTNGGDTWTPANKGIENSRVNSFAIHPADPAIVYAATASSLMKTVDGGATWAQLPWSSLIGRECSAVTIDPRTPNVVYAAGTFTEGEIARSVDGGATWESLTPPTTPVEWMITDLTLDPQRPDTLRAATSNAGVRQITIQPDLAIEAGPLPPNIPLNASFPYKFTISNLGPYHASGVGTVIRLPAGVTDVAASTAKGTCSISGTTVTCTTPALQTGEKIDISVSATLQTTAAVQVSGSVHADQLDANTSNNTVSFAKSVAEQTDLGVRIEGPATAAPGADLRYTVFVTNSGPSPASRVQATYRVPAGMTLGAFNGSFPGSCSTAGADTITCNIESLSANASVMLTVNATAVAAGTYQATASVSTQGIDDVSDNNSALFSTTINSTPAGGGNGGGGGGAISPFLLLGLFALLLGRAAVPTSSASRTSAGNCRLRRSRRTSRGPGHPRRVTVARSTRLLDNPWCPSGSPEFRTCPGI